MEIHREVRIVPIACDAQPFEFLALDIDPAVGKVATFLTEFDDINRVFIQTLFAVFFFYLPFNWQAVAIPTGDIARVAAHHLLAAHDHVFEDLVQCVADVQMPVGIGWAIVQREGLARFRFRFVAQLSVDVHLRPTFQPLRLALGQASAHREICLGQMQGMFVFWGVGAHFRRPLS